MDPCGTPVQILGKDKHQGVIQKTFLGDVSMKKCAHDCDQALIKSS